MLTFVCPVCGNNYLIEHRDNLTKQLFIGTITDATPIYEEAFINDEAEELVGYFCSNCTHQLEDEAGREIRSFPDLLDYLKYSFEPFRPQRLITGHRHIPEA